MTLISTITDSVNAVNWANTEHVVPKICHGYLLKKYAQSDIEAEMTYQSGLGTRAGYLNTLQLRQFCDAHGLTSTTIDDTTKLALDGLPMLNTKHLPYNVDYGAKPYCSMTSRECADAYLVAKKLGYLTSKWDSTLASNELKGVLDVCGHGALYVNPVDNSYVDFANRFYDENANSLDYMLKLFEADKVNNVGALDYAKDVLWAYLNANHWRVDHYDYTPTWQDYECSGAGFTLIMARMRALNNYSLTNWSRMLTDVKARFLDNLWDCPQWTFGATRYYCVIHHHTSNTQRRLPETVSAWFMLHAFYRMLDTTSQSNIRSLLDGTTKAWEYLLSVSGLYDSATKKFRNFNDSSVSDTATCRGVTVLFLQGIVPQVGSLCPPIYEHIYVWGTYMLNKYFMFDLGARTIRIPVVAGDMKFIYGSSPVAYTFDSNGVYEIKFASDWNSIELVTRILDFDMSLLYVDPIPPAPPVPPVPVGRVSVSVFNP